MLTTLEVSSLCYLCARPASRPLSLKNSFTSHSACRVPGSDRMCDRCDRVINGDWQIVWYFNAEKEHPKTKQKGLWSKSFTRNFSWLFHGDRLLHPQIGDPEEHFSVGSDGSAKKPETLAVASDLLTRRRIRDVLLNPPQPPFTLAIAESGQKHILPWAQEALDRDRFPVQFELDTLYVDRAEFTALLSAYESLMALGFSKTEIDAGDYRSDRLVAAMSQGFWEAEGAIAPRRETRTLGLLSFVAQAQASPCS
ncbi:MAG: hypothetical protein SNJ57_18790 [Cyanobacteriota bacterium]